MAAERVGLLELGATEEQPASSPPKPAQWRGGWLRHVAGGAVAISAAALLAVLAFSGSRTAALHASWASVHAPQLLAQEGGGSRSLGLGQRATPKQRRRLPVAPVEPPSDAEDLSWSDANQHDGHLSDSRAAKLLGKTLRAKIDVSQVGCGCVAGFFLYEGDQDPYCDASGSWPGKVERCGEIDLFEGNKFSWHTTLHNRMDHPGQQGGFGGTQQEDMTYGKGPRDMSGSQYGPGGSIIDTEKPFYSAISFPKGDDGEMLDLVVMLYQEGKDEAIEWRVNKPRGTKWMDCRDSECENCYSKPGCVYEEPDLKLFGQMLDTGMTVQSTWWGSDSPWLDGTLESEDGGCTVTPGKPDTQDYGSYSGPHGECDGKSYQVSGWTLEDIRRPDAPWAEVFRLMDDEPVVGAAAGAAGAAASSRRLAGK